MKHDRLPERGYLVLGAGSACMALAHALLSGMDIFSVSAVWTVVLVSIAGQFIYGSCLVQTYRHGDLSIYYPIIRASPLFIVLAQFIVFGKSYDGLVVVGIIMVVGAAAVLAAQPGRYFHYEPKPLIFAVLAMMGTGIYSMADGVAMQNIEAPVLYFWIQVGALFSMFVFYKITGRVGMKDFYGRQHAKILSIGVMASTIMYVSYYLILEAYALGGDVALVTTVRQISIPLSVVLGGLFLRETGMVRRFSASVILGIGIAVALNG